MKRRTFLKALSLSAITALIPTTVFARVQYWWRYRRFDPSKQYGNFMYISDLFDPHPADPIVKFFFQELERGIRKIIPPEYRERIHYLLLPPPVWGASPDDPLAQVGTISWKYCEQKSVYDDIFPEFTRAEMIAGQQTLGHTGHVKWRFQQTTKVIGG